MQVNQVVTMRWSNTGASRYRVVVMNDSTGVGTAEYFTSNNVFNFMPSAAGNWRWQVQSILSDGRYGNALAAWNFQVKAAVVPEPGIPVLQSPSDGFSMQVNQAVTLRWSNTGASRYRIAVMNDTTGVGTAEYFTTGNMFIFAPPSAGNWRWQVQSVLSTGANGNAPTALRLVVNSLPVQEVEPGIPGLLNPASGTVVKVGQGMTLQWSNTGAAKYRLEIMNDSDGNGSLFTDVSGTSYSFTPSAAGNWRWQVRSYKSTGSLTDPPYAYAFRVDPVVVLATNKPNLLTPSNGSRYRSGAPTLTWSAVASQSGGRIEYYAETYDCPNRQNSGWITGTSWTPPTNNLGTYNWHVQAIDRGNGNVSGYGATWQFVLEANPDSQDLHLDIREAKFGPYDSSNTYSQQADKARGLISNDSVTIPATDAFFFSAGDPGPSFAKTLIVTYRNRWNEEWRVTCPEGGSISLNRDSRVGTYLLDGDTQ